MYFPKRMTTGNLENWEDDYPGLSLHCNLGVPCLSEMCWFTNKDRETKQWRAGWYCWFCWFTTPQQWIRMTIMLWIPYLGESWSWFPSSYAFCLFIITSWPVKKHLTSRSLCSGWTLLCLEGWRWRMTVVDPKISRFCRQRWDFKWQWLKLNRLSPSLGTLVMVA